MTLLPSSMAPIGRAEQSPKAFDSADDCEAMHQTGLRFALHRRESVRVV
jgi:hypothetical protein